MLRRTFAGRVPHVTECSALFHGYFSPTVCLPMPIDDNSKITTGGSRAKHTLVLDIDETLIHTFREPSGDVSAVSLGVEGQPAGFSDVADLIKVYGVSNPNPQQGISGFISRASYFKFWTRPYLQEFLAEVSELFEVVFWTAGTPSYMAAIINALERQVISDVPLVNNTTSYLYDVRKNLTDLASCDGKLDAVLQAASKAKPFMNYYGYSRYQTLGSNYLKHIPLLGRCGGSDNVIMMDDATRSFVYTPRSAILVDPFNRRDDNDTFLKDVMPMLRSVAKAPSAAREMDHWRDARYVRHDNLDNNRRSYLMSSPSVHLAKDEVHIGAFLTNRLADGDAAVIPPAKLFGLRKSEEDSIANDMAHLQEQHVATSTGFLHLYRETE